MTEIGSELFDRVFGSGEQGRRLWARVAERLSDLRVEVVAGVRDAQAVPWELLRDRHTDTVLALRAAAFVRTYDEPAEPPEPVRAADGPIRILLVICRPRQGDDVPFRSVASRLVKALSAETQALYQLDVLRPATFTALAARLRAAKAAGEPYHVVHFDGHGMYAEVADRETAADWLRRLVPLALSGPRAGSHGYLLFEDPQAEDNLQLVDGPALGRLLKETGVPVLVLNACRSAHAAAPPQPSAASADEVHAQVRAFGSLAQEVIDCGVTGVVAMRYNVEPIAGFPAGRSMALRAVHQAADRSTHGSESHATGETHGSESHATGETHGSESHATAYTPAEQRELADFLRAAARTKARFLLTSRRDERAWLGELPRRIEGPPMPMQERVLLARGLAEKHGRRLTDVEDWRPLLRFTGGNPLAVTVLVGQALRDKLQTHAQIEAFVEQLRRGEAHVADDVAQGRSRSLAASLQYGFEHAFTEPERRRLALLHFFQGFVDVDALKTMGHPDADWALPELGGLDRESWIALLDGAAQVGLLTAHGGGYYTIHPALPWFFKGLFDEYWPAGTVGGTGSPARCKACASCTITPVAGPSGRGWWPRSCRSLSPRTPTARCPAAKSNGAC